MIPNVPPREASDRLIIFQVSLNVIINIMENRKSCYLKLPFNCRSCMKGICRVILITCAWEINQNLFTCFTKPGISSLAKNGKKRTECSESWS